jgi:hypothetical protein
MTMMEHVRSNAALRIDLWLLDWLGLILECNSGVGYEHQAGGVFCIRRKMEGALVPLEGDQWPKPSNNRSVLEQLRELFGGHSYPKLTADIADGVDSIFKSSRVTDALRVDRSNLEQSCEAWIRVTFDLPAESEKAAPIRNPIPVAGIQKGSGAVVWPNSD